MTVKEWDARYDRGDYLFGTELNAFLVSQVFRLEKGTKALAVADGEGRNGVWLAEKGLDVVALDASSIALDKARALAAPQRRAEHCARLSAIADRMSFRPTDAVSSIPSPRAANRRSPGLQPSPELSVVSAAGRPLLIEEWEIGFKRALPDPEDVGPLAADK